MHTGQKIILILDHGYCLCIFITASDSDVQTGKSFIKVFANKAKEVYIKVQIFDDNLVEGTEAFGVQLSINHFKKNLKLSHPSRATVFIKDGKVIYLTNWI